MNKEESALAQIKIPIQGEPIPIPIPIQVPVCAGSRIFILGRNGTGKSALVSLLAKQWNGKTIYMPGARLSYFDNESLSMTPASRQNLNQALKSYDSLLESRWNPQRGTERNEKAIHDLQVAETQYKINAADQITNEGGSSPAVGRLQAKKSPLNIVNSLLAQANLAVQFEISNAELRVRQNNSLYSYARMSDGERSALIFAAEVVAAQPNMIFLFDEPELHLHPSIVVSLVKALMLHRPDCAFVISTHQLDLPAAIPGAEIVLLRGISWGEKNETSWDVDLLNEGGEIPEWLHVDVIGARRKILFIEGNDKTSLDQPLYSLLFPNISVRPRESCKEVMKAVEGLRAVNEAHRVQAFGLIDHDGMDDEQVKTLENKGIYPLSIFSVESLIYSQEAQQAVAKKQAEMLGSDYQEMLNAATEAAIKSLLESGTKEHLASRIAERQVRDKLLSLMPTREQLATKTDPELNVRISSPFPDELARLTKLVDARDLDGIVCRYPVRESGVLNKIAKGLHFKDRGDYERAVLKCVDTDKNLQNELKKKFGNLASKLEPA